MAASRTQSARQSYAKLGPTSQPKRRSADMATTATLTLSTREKLERSRTAAAKLAQLLTEQKNSLLLQIADTIENRADDIIRANQNDLDRSTLTGSMRDRPLLAP